MLWVPLFALAHWWHLKKSRPQRSVMMGCVFGPAATYFIIGWVVLHKATHLHTVLRSSDCSRTEEFKDFNKAALAARSFHNKCLKDTKQQLLIHYCPGYEDEKAVDNRAQTWEYLKFAEHNYGCAGFCNVAGDPSMWTYQGYQDSCAAATANVMRTKIAALAFQMMVYNIIVVVMFLLWIEVMSPTLKALDRGESLPEHKHQRGHHHHHHHHKHQEPIQSQVLSQPLMYPPVAVIDQPVMSMPPPMSMPPQFASMPGSMPPPMPTMGPQPTMMMSMPPPPGQDNPFTSSRLQ